MYALNYYSNTILFQTFYSFIFLNQLVTIFVMSDAAVLTRYGLLLLFSMHVFLSYVLSLICETVLCLELVFAELGQAHYK